MVWLLGLRCRQQEHPVAPTTQLHPRTARLGRRNAGCGCAGPDRRAGRSHGALRKSTPAPTLPNTPLISTFLFVDHPYKVRLHKETRRIDLLGLVSVVPCPGAWPLSVHSPGQSCLPISLARFPSELATWPRLAVPTGPLRNQRDG